MLPRRSVAAGSPLRRPSAERVPARVVRRGEERPSVGALGSHWRWGEGGTHIHNDRRGAPTTVVYDSGFASHPVLAARFLRQLDALDDGSVFVIGIPMPGCWGAPQLPRLTMRGIVARQAAIIESEVGAGATVMLAGVSGGGAVQRAYAGTYPQSVQAMFDVNSVGLPSVGRRTTDQSIALHLDAVGRHASPVDEHPAVADAAAAIEALDPSRWGELSVPPSVMTAFFVSGLRGRDRRVAALALGRILFFYRGAEPGYAFELGRFCANVDVTEAMTRAGRAGVSMIACRGELDPVSTAAMFRRTFDLMRRPTRLVILRESHQWLGRYPPSAARATELVFTHAVEEAREAELHGWRDPMLRRCRWNDFGRQLVEAGRRSSAATETSSTAGRPKDEGSLWHRLSTSLQPDLTGGFGLTPGP